MKKTFVVVAMCALVTSFYASPVKAERNFNGALNIESIIESGAGKSGKAPKGLISASGAIKLLEIASSSASSSVSYEKSLQQITRDKKFIETVAMISDEINTYEAFYLASTSFYWQGLATHSVIPEFDNPTTPDRLEIAPSDQGIPWIDTIIELPELMPVSVSVDVYSGPCGIGYIIRYTTLNNGYQFSKAEHYGSEVGRGFDWQ